MKIGQILQRKFKNLGVKIPKVFFRVFCFVFFIYTILPSIINADTLNSSNSVIISATVSPNGNNNGGGGGNNGGRGSSNSGGGELNLPTIVNFTGMAYPLSKVYILKDGNIVATTIADQVADFSVSLSSLSTNNYTFSVYGEDGTKHKSSFFSFPIFVTSGTTVNINNIFLSPTIDVDKIEVKQGDNLVIFGQSNPQNKVVISVSSNVEHFFNVFSNAMGVYLYNLDTSILELGQYQTKSKSILGNQTSLYATPVAFSVGIENKPKNNVICSTLKGDLNCDGHVNLIEFSIMAYW